MESGRKHGAEGLRAYEVAQQLVSEVESILREVRLDFSDADQLKRAAESVLLNLSEGGAHYAPGKKAYHYQLARGSAGECIGSLTRIERRGYGKSIARARRTANMCCILLTALIKAQEKRKGNPQ